MSLPNGIRLEFVDADQLADNVHPAILALIITHEEIRSQNIASVLERLLVLTDMAENVRRYRESVVFQVGGYDDDPRELQEIPEVRAYFRTLANEWPYWLWFLMPGVGSFGLLLSLLCEVRVLRTPEGGHGTEFLNPDELRQTLLDLLNREIPLLDASGIGIDEIDSMIGTVLGELGMEAP